jgi:4-hydroxybenzoate polyprenyltransferase
MPDTAHKPPSLLLAWLRLFRIPNVFTALADVLMGFALVQRSFEPITPLACLLLASAFLYTAGMVLNDVFDVEQDTRERPQRPIPSGQISLGLARAVGFGLLVTGVVLGGVAGYLPGSPAAIPWRSAVMALAIAASVVLYDAVLKRTFVAPVFMGLCRFFNVLLGASVAAATAINEPAAQMLWFTNGQLLCAGAIAVYVFGITIFARTEASQSQRIQLTQGFALLAFGIAMLLLVPQHVEPQRFQFPAPWMWPLLLLMLGVSIGRHCLMAIADPDPRRVQIAVKFAILSIITLDAAVTLYAVGPTFALIVFLLVVPAMTLGRWVYST